MVTLAIEGDGGSELTYHLSKQAISVGAGSQNDVVLRAPGVAPRHIVIQRNGAVYTFVAQHRQVVVLNGERRSRGVLRLGDRLRIGTATLVFKGMEEDELTVDAPTGAVAEAVETSDRATPLSERKVSGGRTRSEVALYSEPHRLAAARRQMVDIFGGGVRSDLIPPLVTFFEQFFPERQAMIAWLGDDGRFEPLASRWTAELPRFPLHTFAEVGSGRFAIVRLGVRRILVYPIERGQGESRTYVVLEVPAEDWEDDRLIIAELTRMLAIEWERVETSSSLFGPWEGQVRQLLEQQLPGTSMAIRVLRERIVETARSIEPVLLCGKKGAGRMFVANLIASVHPRGQLSVHAFQAREDDDEASQRLELLGDPAAEAGGLIERARGGVLVVRDLEQLSGGLQRELAAAIVADRDSGYGPRVRWVATTEEDALGLVNSGFVDTALFRTFDHPMLVPGLDDRREDLPLLVVRLLDRLGAEQDKEIRGIELETLNSLLNHPFEGQMTELVAELRRLVSATPSGEMVRGIVPIGSARMAPGGTEEAEGAAVAILARDDLKQVIPFVEHMVIDRVLRRTKGNQSKAARILNLSRGALIAKMKEYEVPDYRYLRRQR
jgi:DNA-binding NtrC family response regulator